MNSGVVFNHNGGYGGDVLIKAPDADEEGVVHTIRVDFDDLAELVADAIRSERISKIENMEAKKLLGLENI